MHSPALASLFCHSLWMISMFLPRVVSAAIMLWCPFWMADVTSRSDSSDGDCTYSLYAENLDPPPTPPPPS